MFVKRNSNLYKILKYLALGGGIVIVSLILPRTGSLIFKSIFKYYFKNKRFEKYRFLRDLKNLQKRELADYQELSDGNIKITLTKLGKEKTLVYDIDDIKLDTSKKWDKQWRLVMFDIPHSQKKSRDVFREKLRELDFYVIQKSVFITPYPCEDEIDFICSVFNIRKFVLIMYVNKFEGEEKFKHYFKV